MMNQIITITIIIRSFGLKGIERKEAKKETEKEKDERRKGTSVLDCYLKPFSLYEQREPEQIFDTIQNTFIPFLIVDTVR